ncbi:hypothetical protein MKW92_008539 [Papaver armeniacum]|nr:hypothetical protein MKW92_008539 [Papaver armeniacum]
MGLALEDALELLNPIMKLQDEVDRANDKEFSQKYRVKKDSKEKLRWDDKLGCLRYPCITSAQERLLDEMYEFANLIPRYWSTALFADHRIRKYMNEEEQEIMLKYLKFVHVAYHGDAKTGFTISLSFYQNPHFKYLDHSKTFRFTRQGISSERSSEIGWTQTQLHTDMPSFFKWYAEDSLNFNDPLAEEIVLEFWPNAHKYYRIGMNMDMEELMIELGRAAKKIKCQGKKSEDEALSKLTTISAELRTAKEEATNSRNTREIEYEVMLVKGEREVHNRRSEIIKSIPHFWLITFLSHYALHYMLNEEDHKIFRFLNSVDVEETEDGEGVVSGYTITLNFDQNPYFENASLKRTISYTIMSTDPLREYSDGKVNIRASDIHWKDTDNGRSFFTWFSGLGCVATEAYDEVADLIKQDLWPDAGRYFVYGNLDDGKKVDLAAINKAARFTSSQRAFFI